LELEAQYLTRVEAGQQRWFAQVDKPSSSTQDAR
jgi:hypothetical protein